MRAAYTALLRLALPLILLRLWWRGRREPRYREAVAERFGRYRTRAKDDLVWIHAVSVGEARAAAPLVKALAEHPILITCTTAAGRETLEQVYGDSVLSAYFPYDYPQAVARFLAHFRPRLAILMETEVWPNLLFACRERNVPVVLLASTREGEEKALLAERAPAAALTVVVPRHPQRFDEVAALADSRRTRQPMPASGERIHLGDTMGEMPFYYGACDVAVIGGSFAPLGGQNLIEALACGAPVVLGPHMFNFAEATRLALDAGAALQAADAPSAMRAAFALLGDEERRRKMSNAGRKLCEAHRGATAHHLAICRRLLEKGSEQFS